MAGSLGPEQSGKLVAAGLSLGADYRRLRRRSRLQPMHAKAKCRPDRLEAPVSREKDLVGITLQSDGDISSLPIAILPFAVSRHGQHFEHLPAHVLVRITLGGRYKPLRGSLSPTTFGVEEVVLTKDLIVLLATPNQRPPTVRISKRNVFCEPAVTPVPYHVDGPMEGFPCSVTQVCASAHFQGGIERSAARNQKENS
jgi:hypothetical protein